MSRRRIIDGSRRPGSRLGWPLIVARPPRRSARELRRVAGLDAAARRGLLYGVVPLWLGAGLADWLCHRRSDIEHTAGLQESAIHALMMTETSIPTLLGLFCEVDAGVLGITLGALGLHQATAIWDVAYAESQREVTATEQHVHGLLEQGPVMATGLLFVLHWDQVAALFSDRDKRRMRRWRPRPKRHPLSNRHKISLLAAVAAFGALPYAEELARCWRARDGSQDQHHPTGPRQTALPDSVGATAPGKPMATDPRR